MKKNQFICAIGVVVLGFLMPCVFLLSNSFDVFATMFACWMTITIPFTIYLGYTSGKHFRKMWWYPLVYSVLLIGVLFIDEYYLTLIWLFGGLGVASVIPMLFWGWFYRDLPKED